MPDKRSTPTRRAAICPRRGARTGEGRLLARLREPRLHPRAARLDGAGGPAARHRARPARPRELLRSRRHRRAQPGARRHAQRADVRARATGRRRRADDEHLLHVPGRPVRVPGAPRRQLGVSRPHQRDAVGRRARVPARDHQQAPPLADGRGDRARPHLHAGQAAADGPARGAVLRLLHRAADRPAGHRRRAPARHLPAPAHRDAGRDRGRLRRPVQVLRLPDHHDEPAGIARAGGPAPRGRTRRRRRLPGHAVPALPPQPGPAAAAGREGRRPAARHAGPPPPPAGRTRARGGPRRARAQPARRPAHVRDRLVDLGRRRRSERHVARYAWPAAVGAAGLAWYAADSLRHRRETGHGYDLRGGTLDVRSEEFLRAAEALTGAPVSWGDEVELLINGDEIFPCYLRTIREAESTVCLLTYVYWRGAIAHDVADALCERASAGVECNVIVDAVGGMKLESDVLERMIAAGVKGVRFRPPKPYALKRVANRTHRKILVADGRVGLTGGVGIAEEWTGNAEDPDHWRDTHLRVEGPVVRGLFGAFAENWLEATGEVLVGPGYLPDIEQRDGGGPMMVVRSSAGVGDSNVEALYYLAIAAARETLDLTAAYFVPRPAFIKALQDCAERGVRTRVLVPGSNIDKTLVWVAGRASYDELVASGVELYEYQPTMLHAKTMTVDGSWSAVGSANFDNRSFQLNDEATLCVTSEEFAGRLTEQFERDLEVSERIQPRRWRRRGPVQRTSEAALKLARREL